MRQAKNRLLSIFTLTILLVQVSFAQNKQDVKDKVSEHQILSPCKSLYELWINFRKNSPYINEEHEVCLNEVQVEFKNHSNYRIVIDGHRDSNERKGISLTRANFARAEIADRLQIEAAQIMVRNFSDTCPRLKGVSVVNRRNEYWLVPKDKNVDEIDPSKYCLPGSTPKIVTDEKPVVWKQAWISWQFELPAIKKSPHKSARKKK
jgi:hypothetical protein